MSAKTVKKTIKDQGITEMFNQMLGTGTLNMNICYPKYENIKNYIIKITDLIEMFVKIKFLESYDDVKNNKVEIEDFIKKARKEVDTIFDINLKDYEWNLNLVDEKVKDEFAEKYEKMKTSEVLKIYITMCNKLVMHKKYLKDFEKINYKFILNMPGIEFCPLPFTKLNFKYMVDNMHTIGNKDQEIKFILMWLHKLMELSYRLYQNYSKPDVDVNEFVEVIMSNIDMVKKHIPRCEKAFKEIQNSVKLLQNNFSNYYKDFIQTKNQMIIMENFVSDVASNVSADAETTRQFKQIIKFYRKHAGDKINNPKIRELFDKVNDHFSELDKHDNLMGIKKLDDDDSEDEEEMEARKKKEAEEEEIKKQQEEEKLKQQKEYENTSVSNIMKNAGLTESKKKTNKKK